VLCDAAVVATVAIIFVVTGVLRLFCGVEISCHDF